MERVMLWLWIFVLVMGVVFAADRWEDINVDSASSFNNVSQAKPDVNNDDGNVSSDDPGSNFGDSNSEFEGFEDGNFYTSDFYIAIFLVVFILIIIGVFVWLWIRGPKNKWE